MRLQARVAAVLLPAPKDLAERVAQRRLLSLRATARVRVRTRTHGRVAQGTGSIGAPLRRAGGRVCSPRVKPQFFCPRRCRLGNRTRIPPNFRCRGGLFRCAGEVCTFIAQRRGQSHTRLAHGKLVVVGGVRNGNRTRDDLAADAGAAGPGLAHGRGRLEYAGLGCPHGREKESGAAGGAASCLVFFYFLSFFLSGWRWSECRCFVCLCCSRSCSCSCSYWCSRCGSRQPATIHHRAAVVDGLRDGWTSCVGAPVWSRERLAWLRPT